MESKFLLKGKNCVKILVSKLKFSQSSKFKKFSQNSGLKVKILQNSVKITVKRLIISGVLIASFGDLSFFFPFLKF